MKSKRLQKKIREKGTENVKHAAQRLVEMRAMYFDMRENRDHWHAQEWIATKRAMKAEAEVKRLKAELEALRNQPELLFPRLTN